MTALYRALRFRELTLLKRTLKLRTVLLLAFLLMMSLTAVQMTAGGTVLADDLTGLFFGTLLAAFLAGFLTNVEYDADKADAAAGWDLYSLVLPAPGADRAAVRYQIKTGVMLIYGGMILLYAAVISAADHFPFLGAAVNSYLLSLCLLEVSSILRHASAAVLGEKQHIKRLLVFAGALLAVIWFPGVLAGLLREEQTLPGNADPAAYFAEQIDAFHVTLLTLAVLCVLMHFGKKATALAFEARKE